MIVTECRTGLFMPVIAHGNRGGSSGSSSSKNTTTINKTPGQTVNREGKGDRERPTFSWKDHLIPDRIDVNASNKGIGGGASWNCGSCHGGKKN
jgi:hypothetical protein